MLTLAHIKRIAPTADEAWAAALVAAWPDVVEIAGLTTATRARHFLAQTAEESGGFQTFAENLNYTRASRIREVWPSRFKTVAAAQPYVRNPPGLAEKVYGGRVKDLGNSQPGDGWRFHGRGPIQLTGRALYTVIGTKLMADLVGNPDQVLNPVMGWKTAAAYWARAGANAFADRGDFTGETRRINGGTTNLEERKRYLALAAKLPDDIVTINNDKKEVPAVKATPPIAGPGLVTPSAPPVTGFFSRVRALFGKKDSVPAIVATKGDPLVYSVQQQLKAKGYYQTGELDGIDGRKTRDAVASIRKDNGLGDGGMTDDFIRRLPSFPQAPVSADRASAGIARATKARPEVFTAPQTLTIGGLSLGGLGGIMGLGGEALTKAKDAADKAGSALDTVQGILDPVVTVLTWCFSHPWLIIGVVGGWFFLKGAAPLIGLWIQWRQGRL